MRTGDTELILRAADVTRLGKDCASAFAMYMRGSQGGLPSPDSGGKLGASKPARLPYSRMCLEFSFS